MLLSSYTCFGTPQVRIHKNVPSYPSHRFAMKISCLLVLSLLLKPSAAYSFWSKAEEPVKEEKPANLVLDKLESVFKQVKSVLRAPGDGVKLLFATSLLLYGKHFSYLCLQLQAFRARGWLDVKDGVQELGAQYKRVRQAIHEAYPNPAEAKRGMEEARKSIASLKKKAAEIQRNCSGDGLVTGRCDLNELKKDIIEAQGELAIATAAFGSFSSLASAIDFPKLKKILAGFYTGAIQLFAVSHSRFLGSLAVGLNLGSLITQGLPGFEKEGAAARMEKKLDEHPYVYDIETRKWLKIGLQVAATSAGLFAATFFQGTALIVSSSLLGGALVTDILVKYADPILQQLRPGAARLTQDPCTRSIIRVAITAVGLAVQFGARRMGGLERLLIWLPATLDRKLRGVPGLGAQWK